MAKESESGQERTEEPTSKRRQKARAEGQVARSQEISLVSGLLAAALYFAIMGPAMVKSMYMLVQNILSNYILIEITAQSTITILNETLSSLMGILLPYMIILVVVAILANILQFGFLLSPKPLKPKFDKFNPVKGMKNFFSPQKLVNLVKTILKIFIIGIVPYIIIKGQLEFLPLIMDMSIWHIMTYIGMILLKILFYISLVMLILAILDYVYQRWEHEKRLKMTKQEVKDEFKQAEGDPKVRTKIRQKQFEFLRKRMMQEVPNADVVITNPVHVAVALKYDSSNMEAPRVVAKGARLVAEKIKQLARENSVPVIENKPLAQSLFKTVDVGETIPESLFKAVAEVLAYVYKQKNHASAAGY